MKADLAEFADQVAGLGVRDVDEEQVLRNGGAELRRCRSARQVRLLLQAVRR